MEVTVHSSFPSTILLINRLIWLIFASVTKRSPLLLLAMPAGREARGVHCHPCCHSSLDCLRLWRQIYLPNCVVAREYLHSYSTTNQKEMHVSPFPSNNWTQRHPLISFGYICIPLSSTVIHKKENVVFGDTSMTSSFMAIPLLDFHPCKNKSSAKESLVSILHSP